MTRARLALPLAALLLAAPPLVAQSSPAPSTPGATQAPAPASALSISGLLFGSYNFTPSTTPNQLANQNDNGFILDRAYLNFRAPAGDRLSVRVTTDVYQTTEATVNAFTIRAKYAYLQYDGARSASGSQLLGRIGILQNVMIEHVEGFWPRYLSQTAVERAGYFSSADAGIAAGATLPRRLGEVYGTIVNGTSYTSRERDRFKDYALRVSLTPLAGDSTLGMLRTLTLSPWVYKGAIASQFVNGGAGQAGAVGEALDRTRYGVFAGLRDPRLVLGAEWAHRRDGLDVGANTAVSPRTAGSVTGRLLSGFAVVRPLAFTNGTGRSPLAVIGRYDQVKPTSGSERVAAPADPANSYHLLIAGVSYDVNPRVTFAADYQESLAANNGVSGSPPVQAKGYFAHFSVAF